MIRLLPTVKPFAHSLSYLAVAAGLVLSACSGPVKKLEPDPLRSIESLQSASVLWSAKAGAGSDRSVVRFAPFVAEDTVFAVNAKGEVSAYDRATGKQIWETGLGSQITAGISGDDQYLYAGSGNGVVYCLNQIDGSLVWKTTVSSEVIAAPSAGADYVVVRSIDGKVYGLSKADGQRRWLYTYSVPALSLHGNGRPLVVPDGVLVGLDNGRLVALRAQDGKTFWESTLAGGGGRSEIDKLSDLDADPVVFESSIYAVNYQGVAARISPADGSALWTSNVSSSAGLAVDANMVVVTDEVDTVWAFSSVDGSVLWKQEDLSHRKLTAPVITAQGSVVVGDLKGFLHILSGIDGSMIGRVKAASDEITARPVQRDGTLYVLDRSGKLAAVELAEAR